MLNGFILHPCRMILSFAIEQYTITTPASNDGSIETALEVASELEKLAKDQAAVAMLLKITLHSG
jgi:hypothetical protein